jgi:hypothetical protein
MLLINMFVVKKKLFSIACMWRCCTDSAPSIPLLDVFLFFFLFLFLLCSFGRRSPSLNSPVYQTLTLDTKVAAASACMSHDWLRIQCRGRWTQCPRTLWTAVEAASQLPAASAVT